MPAQGMASTRCSLDPGERLASRALPGAQQEQPVRRHAVGSSHLVRPCASTAHAGTTAHQGLSPGLTLPLAGPVAGTEGARSGRARTSEDATLVSAAARWAALRSRRRTFFFCALPHPGSALRLRGLTADQDLRLIRHNQGALTSPVLQGAARLMRARVGPCRETLQCRPGGHLWWWRRGLRVCPDGDGSHAARRAVCRLAARLTDTVRSHFQLAPFGQVAPYSGCPAQIGRSQGTTFEAAGEGRGAARSGGAHAGKAGAGGGGCCCAGTASTLQARQPKQISQPWHADHETAQRRLFVARKGQGSREGPLAAGRAGAPGVGGGRGSRAGLILLVRLLVGDGRDEP